MEQQATLVYNIQSYPTTIQFELQQSTWAQLATAISTNANLHKIAVTSSNDQIQRCTN